MLGGSLTFLGQGDFNPSTVARAYDPLHQALRQELVDEARRVAVSVDHPRGDIGQGHGAIGAIQDAKDVELFRRDTMGLQQRTMRGQHGTGGMQDREHQSLLGRLKGRHFQCVLRFHCSNVHTKDVCTINNIQKRRIPRFALLKSST